MAGHSLECAFHSCAKHHSNGLSHFGDYNGTSVNSVQSLDGSIRDLIVAADTSPACAKFAECKRPPMQIDGKNAFFCFWYRFVSCFSSSVAWFESIRRTARHLDLNECEPSKSDGFLVTYTVHAVWRSRYSFHYFLIKKNTMSSPFRLVLHAPRIWALATELSADRSVAGDAAEAECEREKSMVRSLQVHTRMLAQT